MDVVGRIDRGDDLAPPRRRHPAHRLAHRGGGRSSSFSAACARNGPSPMPTMVSRAARRRRRASSAWRPRRRWRNRRAGARTRRTPRRCRRLARVAQLHHHLARLQRVRQHAGEEFFRRQLAAARARPRSSRCRAIVTSTLGCSADGSLCETLPQTVPRFLIAMCATCVVASHSNGQPSRTSALRNSSACRTSAPTVRLSVPACRRLSSSMRLISTTTAGLRMRKFSIGIRLWPPASTRPSWPASPRICRASSSARGA